MVTGAADVMLGLMCAEPSVQYTCGDHAILLESYPATEQPSYWLPADTQA